MPGTETLVYVLGITMFLITVLGGAVWHMLRQEAKDHGEQIKLKADTERMHEMELRWEAQLVDVKNNNERLIDKLERRHDKEITELGQRLGEAIRASETNILNQLHLMLRMLDKSQV